MYGQGIILLPLIEVVRQEIALRLKHILHLHTVGSFVAAWEDPYTRRQIERVFESPQQARHAAKTCAAWLGIAAAPPALCVQAWWRENDGGSLGG